MTPTERRRDFRIVDSESAHPLADLVVEVLRGPPGLGGLLIIEKPRCAFARLDEFEESLLDEMRVKRDKAFAIPGPLGAGRVLEIDAADAANVDDFDGPQLRDFAHPGAGVAAEPRRPAARRLVLIGQGTAQRAARDETFFRALNRRPIV